MYLRIDNSPGAEPRERWRMLPPNQPPCHQKTVEGNPGTRLLSSSRAARSARVRPVVIRSHPLRGRGLLIRRPRIYIHHARLSCFRDLVKRIGRLLTSGIVSGVASGRFLFPSPSTHSDKRLSNQDADGRVAKIVRVSLPTVALKRTQGAFGAKSMYFSPENKCLIRIIPLDGGAKDCA